MPSFPSINPISSAVSTPYINGVEFGSDPEDVDKSPAFTYYNLKFNLNSCTLHPNEAGMTAYAEVVQGMIDSLTPVVYDVQIGWDDANNNDGIRPSSVTATLMDGLTTIGTISLDSSNNWSGSISVAQKNITGTPVWSLTATDDYTISSPVVNNNTTQYTLSHTLETITPSVSINWDDNDDILKERPESVVLKLMNGNSPVETVTLNQANNWSAGISKPVDKYSNGISIDYGWAVDSCTPGSSIDNYIQKNKTVTDTHTTLYYTYDSGKVTPTATPEVTPTPDGSATPTPEVTPTPSSSAAPEVSPTPVPTSGKFADNVISPEKPVKVADIEKTILSIKDEKDTKGSTFTLLKAKGTPKSKKSIKLSWSKVPGAEKYMIFGNKCGKKNKYKYITTVTGTSYTAKKLKKGTYYKYTIVAVKGDEAIATSKTIHVVTDGGKKGNNTKVKLSKTKLSLANGKSKTIKAKLKSKKKVSNHRKVAWESDNVSVAKVNSKGKITAVGKGTCYVYAYAQNGVAAKIKVTVK